MTYCTALDLANAKLTRELAQVATPDRYPVVADDLMEATLRGASRSTYSPEDVAVADMALAVILERLQDADAVIDGYLRARKPTPYGVPLNPVPEIVVVWGRSIARYHLHPDRSNTEEKSDPIVRDYRDALKFLEQVRDGKFSLGAIDPAPPHTSAGTVEFIAPERQFTMDSLRDYG